MTADEPARLTLSNYGHFTTMRVVHDAPLLPPDPRTALGGGGTRCLERAAAVTPGLRGGRLAPTRAGDAYVTIAEPTFVARLLLDPDVDAFVDLPDGFTWALTIFTVDEVGRLL